MQTEPKISASNIFRPNKLDSSVDQLCYRQGCFASKRISDEHAQTAKSCLNLFRPKTLDNCSSVLTPKANNGIKTLVQVLTPEASDHKFC